MACYDTAGDVCQVLYAGGKFTPDQRVVYEGQGLTLVHFSAQPEPFLKQKTP